MSANLCKILSKYKIWLLSVFLFIACNNDNNKITYKQINNQPKSGKKDTLKLINKSLITTDRERITAYIKRRDWNMSESKTGLWFEIYQHGKGIKLKKGAIVKFNYKLELLDGTLCYSSDSLGVKELKVGQGGIESGLEEALLILKRGDKARFILPPYLAHGLLGDNNKIPTRAIIVYYIEIL